eukprot:scaffold2773_cov410-Prasinococcus_capsulatus_cf.AAC.21
MTPQDLLEPGCLIQQPRMENGAEDLLGIRWPTRKQSLGQARILRAKQQPATGPQREEDEQHCNDCEKEHEPFAGASGALQAKVTPPSWESRSSGCAA